MRLLETIELEWKKRLKQSDVFWELFAPFLVEQEWGLGDFNSKDGKGTQIAQFNFTVEDGI